MRARHFGTSLMRDQCHANWELAPDSMEDEGAMVECGGFDLMGYDTQEAG